MSIFQFPEYKLVQYRKGDESQWYELTAAPPAFGRMPFNLKMEERQRADIVQADLVLTGRIVNGKRKFFTGLRPAVRDRYFYGDDFRRGRKHFVIVQISHDTRFLCVFYFRGFYPEGDAKKERLFTEFFSRLDNRLNTN